MRRWAKNPWCVRSPGGTPTVAPPSELHEEVDVGGEHSVARGQLDEGEPIRAVSQAELEASAVAGERESGDGAPHEASLGPRADIGLDEGIVLDERARNARGALGDEAASEQREEETAREANLRVRGRRERTRDERAGHARVAVDVPARGHARVREAQALGERVTDVQREDAVEG